jgi:hypothetical protein
MVKKRLGEMLLEAGIIDAHKLQAALGHQRKWGGRLGQALVDLKFASEEQIVAALSRKFGYQTVPSQALEGGPMLESSLKLVPREFASRNNLIPFAMDSSTISVAMSDPANIAVVDEIRFRTGRRVQIALAGDREIAEAVRRHYFVDQSQPATNAISLDLDTGPAPSETVVEQFGGGSPTAYEDFFSRAPGPLAGAPSGPVPMLFPAASPVPAPQAASATADSATPAVDLQELLSEAAPAPAAAHAPAAEEGPRNGSEAPVSQEDSISIELPLVEMPPESSDTEGQPVMEALHRLTRGEPVSAEVVKPVQMLAAVVRLLLQKRIITEEEFLAEFDKK